MQEFVAEHLYASAEISGVFFLFVEAMLKKENASKLAKIMGDDHELLVKLLFRSYKQELEYFQRASWLRAV